MRLLDSGPKKMTQADIPALHRAAQSMSQYLTDRGKLMLGYENFIRGSGILTRDQEVAFSQLLVKEQNLSKLQHADAIRAALKRHGFFKEKP